MYTEHFKKWKQNNTADAKAEKLNTSELKTEHAQKWWNKCLLMLFSFTGTHTQ